MKMAYALFRNDILVLSTYSSSKHSHTLSFTVSGWSGSKLFDIQMEIPKDSLKND